MLGGSDASVMSHLSGRKCGNRFQYEPVVSFARLKGRSTKKRSEHELKRLIEEAVDEGCGLHSHGLWLCVEKVELSGHPPASLKVWATLHFLPSGSPFCCGEPECHLGLRKRGEFVADHVRRAMHLEHPISVDFGNRIGVHYHEGVLFTR